MKIRTHKTSTNNRSNYIYYFGDGEQITLVPGKDGVTEEDIRQLHLADDREVENNLKYYTVKLPNSKNDKNENTEKVWLSSFEQTFKGQDEDKTHLMLDASVYNPADTADKVTDLLMIKEISGKDNRELLCRHIYPLNNPIPQVL